MSLRLGWVRVVTVAVGEMSKGGRLGGFVHFGCRVCGNGPCSIPSLFSSVLGAFGGGGGTTFRFYRTRCFLTCGSGGLMKHITTVVGRGTGRG